jgi:hypothetical protein
MPNHAECVTQESLAADPRLVDDLAAACSQGAAAWWQRRPDRYRLVTAPDEQTRCCFVTGGARCRPATAYRIASLDGALDDYTYGCREHRAVNRAGTWAQLRCDVC